MWVLGSGTLRYSPKLLGSFVPANWWVVVDCDPEVGRYCRQLYHLYHNRCRTLLRPSWKEHISVLRDEEPKKNKAFWNQKEGKKIFFFYDVVVKTNGEYYWLDVIANELFDLRKHFGLSKEPEIPLHMSVGHVK